MGSTGSKRASSPETVGKREAVRVRLLGGFRVSVGSRAIPQDAWRLRKAAALVKLLALAPDHRMHREQLMNLLWPESGRKAASNNLRQVVYGARKLLDPSSGSREGYLSLKDEHIVLCPDGQLWVDVDAFEDAAASVRRSKDPSAYRSAIELYAGELLPEDRYEEWAEGRRAELRQLYLRLLIELAGLYEEREEHAPTIETLRKATSEEPTLEEAHASLMRLHALSGRPESALAQYERLRDALQRGIGTRPTEATRRLRDEIAAGRLPSSASADRIRQETSDGAEHNLPAPMTSFVGREREMVEVKRTLAMTRLLTLTGAGGTGKTRLSLEVARDLLGTYPGGVWLVELAPISDPELVAQDVANVLGVQERPGEPLADTLVDALAAKEMLLVVDNCEHVVEGAARLVDKLLASCPSLRVLATSREPLGVSGEVVWPVPPLSLPGDTTNEGLTADALVRYEAVRLFVDRARLRLLDFEVNEVNAGAVARVCRKLEGIPLAIELATARMGAIAVEQVAERLEASLDVLKGNSRSAAPRQQTLRATLDWSHDLLSAAERALFRRLSVFAGGWTLEAAEEVCSGDGTGQEDVLDLLGGLVDKSLMVAGPHTGGAVRYRMLEPIRQYALEKLVESGEAELVKSSHAEFFLALAEEEFDPGFGGPEDTIWLHHLEVEHDNMRAALSWALEGGDVGLGLRLAAALSYFWDMKGHFDDGVRGLQDALAKGGATVPSARAGALAGLGNILRQQGDLVRAEACHEEALDLYKKLGDQGRVAGSLAQLGFVAERRGDSARAAYLLEESIKAGRGSGNLKVIPSVLNSLAHIALEGGDLERAGRLRREVLASIREQGNSLGNSGLLLDVGYNELAVGDRERATALLEESLVLSRKLGDKWVEACCLSSLGIAATLRGDPEQAKALLKKGLAMDVEMGSKADIAEDLEGLAEAAGALEDHPRAARLWGAAFALREAIGIPWWAAERVLHEPLLMAARSQLDEGAWETAFAEGQAIGLEQSVAYAFSEASPDPPTARVPGEGSFEGPTGILTHREREVATLVARGLTNRQIARELSISERTAGNHVARILRKLGLRSRTQIGALVVEDRP